MSHEIRTPLNAVMGFVNLMAKTELTEKQRDYMEKIKLASNTLFKAINDILDFSKIEAKKFTIELTGFYLPDVLNNVANMLAEKACSKGLKLNVFIKNDVPRYLIGDSFRLEQILINLTDNAIKFTQEGEITLQVEFLDKESSQEDTVYLLFSVIDTGTGISKDKQKELFEPFIQADGSTTRKFGGTGLGLSICKSLVKLMGGEIGLESQSGKGSKFYFILPFKKMDYVEEKKVDKLEEEYSNLYGAHVLLVEDNPLNQQVALEMLRELHITVDLANNGVEALKRLKSEEKNYYDAILMDIQMPEMDDFETTKM